MIETCALGALITATIVDEQNRPVAQTQSHNLMADVGLQLIAGVLNWSGARMQNGPQQLGMSSTDLAQSANSNDLYGAVGTGTNAPLSSNTQLGSEVDRATLAFAQTQGASWTWTFYMAPSSTTYVISEGGVFALANSNANSGVMLDQVLFSPTVNKGSNQGVLLTATFTVEAQGA